MYVVKIVTLGFIPKSDHTLGYVERVRERLGLDDRDQSRRFSTEAMWIGNALGDAMWLAREAAIGMIRVFDFNPKDFYYTLAWTQVDSGMFFEPTCEVFTRYRLSDGVEIS